MLKWLLSLAPTSASLAAVPAVGPVLMGFQLAWRFITSPVGKVVGAGVVALGCYVAGDIHGHNEVMTKWRAANEQAELASRKRDADIKSWANSQVQAANEDLKTQTSELQKQVDDYEQALADRDQKLAQKPAAKSGDNCGLSSDDIKRLRRLK